MENGAYLFPVTRLHALVKSYMIGFALWLYYIRSSPYRIWLHRYVNYMNEFTCDKNIPREKKASLWKPKSLIRDVVWIIDF
jgi:hypothetical protein